MTAKSTTQRGGWTTQELKTLRDQCHLGAKALAELLGRPVWSVKKQAARMRISLRRPGVRCGLILGQPRDASLRPDPKAREAILSGSVDAALYAKRLELDGPLCPTCGRRPVRVPRTGLCGVCHKERQTDAMEEAAAELAAQARYSAAKMKVQRLKNKATKGADDE